VKILDIFKKLFGKKKDDKKNKYIESASMQSKTSDALYIDELRGQLTEKENIIKTIKKEKDALEDNFDEKTYDLKISNNKLEGLKKEFELLKNSHRELENDYTAKQHEFENIKQKNEVMELDLGIKTKSIDIVNEILTAKDADDRDTEEIHNKVKEIIDFVNIRVREDFRNTTNLTINDYLEIHTDIERWGNIELKTWLMEKKVLAFVGEFSSGKTSIVNRILTQDNENTKFKLPVSATPTTAIATYISHGQETRVQFTDTTGNLKNINFKTFSQFSKSILEKIHVTHLIRHFVIKYNNQNLEKLSILDTPGFSSNDKNDERRTVEVIREADALFWVIDINMGEINEISLRIIKEHMSDIPLYIVINKSDTKSPNERDLVKNKIQKTMENNDISICEYIEFSKIEPLDNIMRIISDIHYRKEGNDNIINRIYKEINKNIQNYNDDSTIFRKNIRKIQEKININEKSIAELIDKINNKKKAINKKRKELESEEMIGGILWNKGKKLKDPDSFWKLVDERTNLFYNGLELYEHLLNISNELKDNENKKSKYEFELDIIKRKSSTLKKLKNDFTNLMYEYGYEIPQISIINCEKSEEEGE